MAGQHDVAILCLVGRLMAADDLSERDHLITPQAIEKRSIRALMRTLA